MTITADTPLDTLPQFLSPMELGALLRIGRSAAYEAIRRGDVRSVRMGRLVRIPREAIIEMARGGR